MNLYRILYNSYSLAALKRDGLKDERVMLLDAWKEVEVKDGSPELVEKVYPRRVAMKRMVTGNNGEDVGWEEYYDYQFPDDEASSAGLKILENAMKWKQMMAAGKEESVLGKRPAEEDIQEWTSKYSVAVLLNINDVLFY